MKIEFEVEFTGEGRPRKIGKGDLDGQVVIAGEGHKAEKKEGK